MEQALIDFYRDEFGISFFDSGWRDCGYVQAKRVFVSSKFRIDDDHHYFLRCRIDREFWVDLVVQRRYNGFYDEVIKLNNDHTIAGLERAVQSNLPEALSQVDQQFQAWEPELKRKYKY